MSHLFAEGSGRAYRLQGRGAGTASRRKPRPVGVEVMEARLLLAGNPAPTFQPGDVILGGLNFIEWHRADGTLVKSLTSPDVKTSDPNNPGEHEGLIFDSAGNLYSTNFVLHSIDKFDPEGNFLGNFGDAAAIGGAGGKNSIESVVSNSSGDFFVGAPDGDKAVKELDPTGKLIHTFAPAVESRGTDWVELGPDQQTLYYTSEGHSVKTFNLATRTQGPDFATNLPGKYAYQLRLLPDGTMLVADNASILHLDKTGAIVKQYTAPNETEFFAVNLDPDGKSFWSASNGGQTVYKFDIATGNIVEKFNAVNFSPSSQTTSGDGIVGIVIAGQITQATTADLALAAVNPVPTAGTVGGNVTFTYKVSNNGPNASPATFTDAAPAGLTVSSVTASQGTARDQGGTATADLGVVPNGGSATVTVTFAVKSGGTISNTATVTGQSDPTAADNTVTGQITVAQPAAADLAITAPVAGLQGKPGDVLTKTFVVTNAGPGTATSVTFTDPLPEGLTLIRSSFTTTGGGVTAAAHKPAVKRSSVKTLQSRTVDLALGSLAPGATDTVTIVVMATAAGTFTNTATVSSPVDDNPDNNSAAIRIVIQPPVVTDGPRVVAVRRYGYHTTPTTLVVSFDQALDPASAGNALNYRITDDRGRTVPVTFASYAPGGTAVTLFPLTSLDLHRRYTLTIFGDRPGGVSGAGGGLLDGAGTGRAGSNYVTTVDAADLVVTDRFARGATAALRLAAQAHAADARSFRRF